MKFKSDIVQNEFFSTTIFLQQMAIDMDNYCKKRFNKEIFITRVKEKVEGATAVHDDGRAFDVRSEFEGVKLFDSFEVASILDFMNTKYRRNDKIPTCIHHSFNGGPYHFHVQIAALTKAYEGVEE